MADEQGSCRWRYGYGYRYATARLESIVRILRPGQENALTCGRSGIGYKLPGLAR